MKTSLRNTYDFQRESRKTPPALGCPVDVSEKSSFNKIKRRPLESSMHDVSFKGLSTIKVSDAVKKFGEEFGESAASNFKEKIIKASSIKNSGISIQNDQATFVNKNLAQRFVDLLKYPVVEMPLDMANSTLGLLRKIGLKDSKIVSNLHDSKILSNRRAFKENTSEIASFQHYFELAGSNKKAFADAHNRFSPDVSNYDSTIERTLTRVVTGSIPAFFLANDAYNLSIYMNNNKELAKKEKKRRFNQEVARIGITAGATFAVLRLFSKQSNASGMATVYLMSGLTFVSEIIGRKLAGTPVLPLNEKGAKRYAKKQGKTPQSQEDKKNQQIKTDASSSTDVKKVETEKAKDKGGLTIKNVLKAMGAMAVVGLGIEKASSIKSVKTALADLNKKYTGLYLKDYNISRGEFDKLTKKLDENGFDKIAQKYRNIIKDQKGETLNLGKVDSRAKKIIIHNAITFPIRFAYDVLMLPYNGIAKPIFGMLAKGFKKVSNSSEASAPAKDAKKEADKELQILKNSIQYLKRINDKPDFKERINKSILASLDNETKSNYSNADLSVIIKNTMSAITSGFLIADNYNLVMIDSGGKDKNLAEQKAKERTIQRTMRIVYGAFLIKFLNGIFAGPYNASLLGAQAVNSLYTISTETLERTSVGLPLTESTRAEMQKKDKANLNAGGFRGGYYKLMAKLTGKKPMVINENK